LETPFFFPHEGLTAAWNDSTIHSASFQKMNKTEQKHLLLNLIEDNLKQ
jgi:hypothetical protein